MSNTKGCKGKMPHTINACMHMENGVAAWEVFKSLSTCHTVKRHVCWGCVVGNVQTK